MRERPILFSGPMVRAILAGQKTQTRRVAKDVRHPDFGNLYAPGALAREPQHVIDRACPNGQPGDRLWVREAHYLTDDGICEYPVFAADDEAVRAHLADIDALPATFPSDVKARHRKLRPSIHMPRWVSRILLAVIAVRLERLQQISDADCWAEGIEECDGLLDEAEICRLAKAMGRSFEDPRPTFAALWESINGPGAWDANPWVWVPEFRQVVP